MAESITDEQENIERVMLWHDIVDVFRANAFSLGVQMSPNVPEHSFRKPTLLVLESEFDGEYTVRLWGEVTTAEMVSKATIIFNDYYGIELFNYEITPSVIKQYSPEPTSLDKEDLQDLRDDLGRANWNPEESEWCARNVIFFD